MFQKRKRGIIKKAIEISKLTGAKAFLTLISEDDMTATSYKSVQEGYQEVARRVKSIEVFRSDLDFDTIEACTKTEVNHTIGRK